MMLSSADAMDPKEIVGTDADFNISALLLKNPWPISTVRQFLSEPSSLLRQGVAIALRYHQVIAGTIDGDLDNACFGPERISEFGAESGIAKMGGCPAGTDPSDPNFQTDGLETIIPHTHTGVLTYLKDPRLNGLGVISPRTYIEFILSIFDDFCLNLCYEDEQKIELNKWQEAAIKVLGEGRGNKDFSRIVNAFADLVFPLMNKDDFLYFKAMLRHYVEDNPKAISPLVLNSDEPNTFRIIGPDVCHYHDVNDYNELHEISQIIRASFSVQLF